MVGATHIFSEFDELFLMFLVNHYINIIVPRNESALIPDKSQKTSTVEEIVNAIGFCKVVEGCKKVPQVGGLGWAQTIPLNSFMEFSANKI